MGQPEHNELKEGDVVVRLGCSLYPAPLSFTHTLRSVQGLLLDLDAATLTVWVNGERKGVMVRPGMTDGDVGEPVGRLEGPLRWAIDLPRGGSVAIAGPLPVPEEDE